jgi:hypothetical protein
MKKKKNILGIVSIFLMVMAFNFNMSRTDHNGDTSLLNIKTMAHAAGENYCTEDIIGTFCYKFESGDSYCTSGTSGSCLD